MKITTDINADHANDLQTQKSVTSIFLFLNGTLQNWYSKQKLIVEMSTHGSELVAIRITVKIIMEYHYKLRMLRVPILGISVIYEDNMAVITNASIPGSNIKK